MVSGLDKKFCTPLSQKTSVPFQSHSEGTEKSCTLSSLALGTENIRIVGTEKVCTLSTYSTEKFCTLSILWGYGKANLEKIGGTPGRSKNLTIDDWEGTLAHDVSQKKIWKSFFFLSNVRPQQIGTEN